MIYGDSISPIIMQPPLIVRSLEFIFIKWYQSIEPRTTSRPLLAPLALPPRCEYFHIHAYSTI